MANNGAQKTTKALEPVRRTDEYGHQLYKHGDCVFPSKAVVKKIMDLIDLHGGRTDTSRLEDALERLPLALFERHDKEITLVPAEDWRSKIEEARLKIERGEVL